MTKNNKHNNFEAYLQINEAASYLGISASTLRNWDRQGKLEAFRHPINGYRLYKKEDLQKILDNIGLNNEKK